VGSYPGTGLLRGRLGQAGWAGLAARLLERERRALGDGPVRAPGRAYLALGIK
jgi:hypothetical protein